MPGLNIDFFLTGLGRRLQIGLFMVVCVAVLMGVVIGFTIWQERTSHRK